MVLSPNYEIVEIADEVIVVPVGEEISHCKDVFSFSKAGSVVIKQLKSKVSSDDLVDILVNEFDVDKEVIRKDLEKFLSELQENKLIVL